MIKRLIVNITNLCNEYCPFCCAEASSKGHNYMTLSTFQNILSSYNEEIEVQLTGGEPTLHPSFLEFVKCAIKYTNIKKLIVDTNGTDMGNVAKDLNEISRDGNAPIIMKLSVNYWLVQQHVDYLEKVKNTIINNPCSSTFEIVLSFAQRIPEELDNDILKDLKNDAYKNGVRKIITHPIAYQGRARKTKLGNTCLEKMRITTAIPIGYATDGTCFGEDLDARNAYELVYNE